MSSHAYRQMLEREVGEAQGYLALAMSAEERMMTPPRVQNPNKTEAEWASDLAIDKADATRKAEAAALRVVIAECKLRMFDQIHNF